jgi:hypothetical protein
MPATSSVLIRGLLCGCTIMASTAGCADAASTGNFTSQFGAAKPSAELKVDFEDTAPGRTPADFTTDLTGGGAPVSWVVQEDGKAPSGKRVLAQTSADSTDYRFPVCVHKDFSGKNVQVSVSFKAVAGKVDQAGGIVVRYRDKDNYYVVRANALEDNVRLYHVVDGERKQFAGASTKVSFGEWHRLTLGVKGKHFQVFFDDKPLFEADDATFAEAGRVGLWTKADSVTRFDDLTAEGFDAK